MPANPEFPMSRKSLQGRNILAKASMCITPKWFTLGWTLFLGLAASLSPAEAPNPREDPRDRSSPQSHLESQQAPLPPVFWELQPAQVDAMLLPIPDGDDSRYLRLHEYFSDLHCPSNLMVEQAVPKHIGKNLICVLPGKNAEQILVVARYDRRRERIGEGWSEAVMLPILYNALRAEPRQHTFVFAALNGGAGEKELFVYLRKNSQAPVKTMVVLDRLGMGEPRFYTARNKMLDTEAAFTAHLQGISNPMNDRFSQSVSENGLLSRADGISSILLYSAYAWKVSAPDFRKEFDFGAYYLCRIDIKLAIPATAPPH